MERLAVLDGMPGVRLVIVGDGPSRAALTERLPNAVFLGELHGNKLSAAFASLDVFVHTGPHETCCQAVQEAMASGVPVLAPDAGGPRDLVEHGRTGFLLPAQRAGFTAALPAYVRRLADAPQLRSALAAAARSAVKHRTWPAVCAQLVDHYAAVQTERAHWLAA